MAIQTVGQRNALATAYGAAAPYASVYTTVPSTSQGTEPTGGSPAFARKACAWGAAANSAVTCTVVFDIPTGTTIVGAGLHSALTAGNYLDGGAVTSQAFASQGTYSLTITYTQT